MKIPWSLLVAIAVFPAAAFAETEESLEIHCLKSGAFFAAPDSSDYLKYAPDRHVDILHLALDVTPDFSNRTVAVKSITTFKPIAKPLEELSLDAVDLTVDSVEASEAVANYQVTDEKLIVTFAKPVPADKEVTVKIASRAEPVQGLYFRTPEMGYKEGDTHLFTQGEETEARYWYPSFDEPNEKFTSEVTCRVPEGMTVVSNGKLLSQANDPATGLVAFRWSQDKPHVNYLITLVAGYLKKLEDRHRDIPLGFYTQPSAFNEASNSFAGTKDMMEFFEKEIGVPYPWAKYDQVCVNDFVAGGMENTSATTLTDNTLFTGATENIRSSEGLVAHELAHQWFGDLTTCKDWSHIWLNEGFATYYEVLYSGHKHGRDQLLYDLHGNAGTILGVSNDVHAIVRRDYNQPGDMFGYLAYPKGAWVLHMLRSQLGEDLYRRCIKTWVERHAYGNVTTDDLLAVVEELSGRSYDQFFNQWVYHAHHPELEIKYSWDEKTKLARVSVAQNQKLSDNVLLFNFPTAIRFKGKFGAVDRPIRVKEKTEDFYFPLDSAPEIVRFDPEYTVLAKVTFDAPNAMLYAQLADTNDTAGRLKAADVLGSKKSKETVAKLKQALNSDPFYGVRIEVAKALRTIHSEEALSALLASTNQPDARVRQQVYSAIGNFYDPQARAAQLAMLAREKNPDIQTIAIRDLGGYPDADREMLLQYLNSTSYRNALADVAISAIRAQNDPSWIDPLRQNLQEREKDYTSRGFARGLNTLAYLARDEEDKKPVCDFLLKHVNHRKRSIQTGAIEALGVLGDPRAVAALESFAVARRDSPEQQAASRAIQAIQNFRRSLEGLGDLRKEFLDLQKENRELRKDFEALEKKFNALNTRPADKQAPRTAKSPKDR